MKRITSGGAHLHDLAPGQHSFEETAQQWRAVGDTVTFNRPRNRTPEPPRLLRNREVRIQQYRPAFMFAIWQE